MNIITVMSKEGVPDSASAKARSAVAVAASDDRAPALPTDARKHEIRSGSIWILNSLRKLAGFKPYRKVRPKTKAHIARITHCKGGQDPWHIDRHCACVPSHIPSAWLGSSEVHGSPFQNRTRSTAQMEWGGTVGTRNNHSHNKHGSGLPHKHVHKQYTSYICTVTHTIIDFPSQ